MTTFPSDSSNSVREAINEMMNEMFGHTEPKPDLFVSQNICLEDIRMEWQIRPFMSQGQLLKDLKGRTIRYVRWDSERTTTDNPQGFGRFIIEVEPK